MTSPRGPQAAVIRPPAAVEAVRADARRAAEDAARLTGDPPDYLIPEVIDWALGRRHAAPATGTPAPAGGRPPDAAAEISACRRYLQSTPWRKETADTIGRARDILEILEWLTGASDVPPAYASGTEPGDLTGGHGPVVRTPAEIQAVTARATAQLAVGDTTGWGSGPGWHQGVIATLEWAAGHRAEPPLAHPGGTACTHPPSVGRPSRAEMTRERRAAEEHLQPGGYQHGSHSPGYADAVATTLRWLWGQTTTPPVHP